MYKLLLCLRYLKTRYIALASIVSVMLGVATMIVVNSVMAGFSTEMRDRLHGILADVIVEVNTMEGSTDIDRDLEIIRNVAGDYIGGMAATVEVFGMITFQYYDQYVTQQVTIIGIKPEEKATVGPLVDYLESYQTVMEDGKVIQQPLRDRSEPPGWELTTQAAEYRRARKAREQWRNRLQRNDLPTESQAQPLHGATNVSADETAPPPFVDQAVHELDTAINVTTEVQTTATEVPASEPSFSAEAVAAPSANPNDIFDPLEPQTPIDPAQPFKARVYVGKGRVSYPWTDPETGKTKIELMVRPGDDVRLTTYNAGRPPEGRHFNATVVDLFNSGMSEYDSALVFCNLEELQNVRGMIDPTTGKGSVTSVQIKLKDYNDAEEVVQRLQANLTPGVYSVRTWEQKQGPLLAAVEIERAILNVLLFLIIAVAGFGILAIFCMIVVEKTRDIGILKALGAGSNGIMSIFLTYGLSLGVVGSVVGVVLGLLFVKYINEIEAGIAWLTGRKVFPDTIYYFPEIPTAVHPWTVTWVALGAIGIAVLASVIPARRAARLKPVEALRYE